ncbi:hypothetical protein EJP67_33060 [Variovorax guangxiensis]|uniref:TrbI/VirB10 family protein n=1 Tax=Variovorax guangxiensis TaxID=1775474 RepID=A0A433MVN7_9BURK|nr:type IV secretion system protein VirB10 [Variovorax guangxiensis]RUR71888.1 hypothetical protein EJP67_33060 [Variovorax guangxiensis]
MATDNNNGTGAAISSSGATGQPADLGIVSVNSRGGSSSNMLPKVIFVVLLLAIVLVGGLFAVNKWRAFSNARDAAASKDDKNENRPALVGLRRKFDSDPQFAESAPKIDAKGGPCDDGTPGVVLVGPDGNAMLAPSGQAMRVCKDGRVISPGGPAKVVPEVKSGAQQPQGAATTPPPSRYAGDVIVPVPSKPLAGAAPAGPSERSMQTLAMVQDILGKTTGQQAAGGFGSAPGSTVNLGGAGGTGGGGGGAASPQGSIGSLLTPSATPMVQAGMLGDRNMILPKGRTIDCGLSMRLVNEVTGMATCVISSDVYSDNGRVLLLERGSEATGEYMSAMQQGQKRIFVLWTRVKTPNGVVMNLNSPAADSLGTSGLDGYIDNHWFERIGAAVMLSLVQDAIAYKTTEAGRSTGTGTTAQGGTVVLQNSQQTGSSLAEKILASTINIKPTLYKNQGDRASIFVARDLDFGTVYALRPR